MSLQWTEDGYEGSAPKESRPLEKREIVNKEQKPLRRKDLTKEIGRYENRTQQKLIQVKYHTNKFLALVSTYQKQQKLVDMKETEKANRGGTESVKPVATR